MLRQRSGTIIIVVVVALFVGYSVHTAVESRRTQAVARAIEEYMAVLDAEWVDADCMPDHCPKSSKSLPGVPQDRALFTTTEGGIIRGRGKDVSTVAPVRSSLAIYELKKQKHGVVEAYGMSPLPSVRSREVMRCFPICTGLLLPLAASISITMWSWTMNT